MFKNPFLFAAASAVAPVTWAARSWACAVCLTGANDSTADGFNASVLFLMSTPYLVVGSIVGALIFSYRRALRRREHDDGADEGEPVAQFGWKQEESGR